MPIFYYFEKNNVWKNIKIDYLFNSSSNNSIKILEWFEKIFFFKKKYNLLNYIFLFKRNSRILFIQNVLLNFNYIVK